MTEKLLAVQRLLFLALTAWLVLRASAVRHPARAPRPPAALQTYSGLLVLAFAALTGTHFFWAFAGHEVAGFREVMSHDPRAFHLALPSDRRDVVDRHGEALIRSVADGHGARREYPQGRLTAHLTGYYDRTYGKTGLEAACDDRLSTWRPSALGALRLDEGPAPDGRYPPLELTIDLRLQRAAAEAMGDRTGAVVAVAPASGEVLVLFSRPGFDPNQAGEALPTWQADQRSPLLNRALAGRYPPGSTFKPVTAVAALAAGLPIDTAFDAGASGYLAPGDDEPIEDLEAGVARREGRTWAGHGALDMPEAMARSANGYFAWLSVKTGPEPILAAARVLGLTQSWNLVEGRRNVDLRTLAGSLPAGRLKPGDVARVGIGQGEVLVTPMGLTMVAAAIANYGRQVPPRLLALAPPRAPREVMDVTLAEQLREMMRGAVTAPRGTARGVALPAVAVAAKTGSAENPHGKPHSWVMALAPTDGATIALAVIVENGGWGSQAAAPVARAVLRAADAAGYFAGDAP